MPRIPRSPQSRPRTPSPPRLGRVRLRAPRPPESLRLDTSLPRDRYNRAGGEDGLELEPIPYVSWEDFLAGFEFIQGEHVTLVGATGSGKTTLALKLLDFRAYVIALATKQRDESLYPKLAAKGYYLTGDPQLDYHQHPKIIFRPALKDLSKESKEQQKEDFKAVLDQVFDEGNWCLYGDEIRYLSDNLGLATELNTLWLQGRSMGVSMVVATQRPVSIPVIAFESATHLFLFRATDRVNIQRSSEFGGADVDLIRYTLPRLPRYEVLYVDTRTGEMLRTKVRL
jgi:AAA domain